MLTHEDTVRAVAKAATKFSLKQVAYFGSYADGKATEERNLDILGEFTDDDSISLLDVITLKYSLEDELNTKIDVVGLTLSETAKKRLKIKKTVPVYERT
jgi:predicted nucleotidyltransferase